MKIYSYLHICRKWVSSIYPTPICSCEYHVIFKLRQLAYLAAWVEIPMTHVIDSFAICPAGLISWAAAQCHEGEIHSDRQCDKFGHSFHMKGKTWRRLVFWTKLAMKVLVRRRLCIIVVLAYYLPLWQACEYRGPNFLDRISEILKWRAS
jgi:hypothetical protein